MLRRKKMKPRRKNYKEGQNEVVLLKEDFQEIRELEEPSRRRENAKALR